MLFVIKGHYYVSKWVGYNKEMRHERDHAAKKGLFYPKYKEKETVWGTRWQLDGSLPETQVDSTSETKERTRSLRQGLTDWFLQKDLSLPSINLIDDSLLHQLVPTNLGQEDGPDQPVDASCRDDAEPDDAVYPVGQILVDVLAVLWGYEGCRYEVDVAQQEEENYGKGRFDRRCPVPCLSVEI